jgi:hypothetical protein
MEGEGGGADGRAMAQNVELTLEGMRQSHRSPDKRHCRLVSIPMQQKIRMLLLCSNCSQCGVRRSRG